MSSLSARMRLIKSKIKELECSQDFSHYKPMGIFPDAQGQLTPQSLVRSNQILNSVETLWLSSLPVCIAMIAKTTLYLIDITTTCQTAIQFARDDDCCNCCQNTDHSYIMQSTKAIIGSAFQGECIILYLKT